VKAVSLILLSGVLGVSGQVALKQALATAGPLPLSLNVAPAIVWSLLSNPLIVGGLAVYVTGTFFWLVALSRVDLSYAYPFASLNYIFVVVASWLVLHEQPTPARLAGVLAICIGVGLLSRTRATTARSSMRGARP
jgi:drug/metabolite transporter (DMT)-like permease